MRATTPAPEPVDPRDPVDPREPVDPRDPVDDARPEAASDAEPSGDGRSRRWVDHRLARRTELVHAARRAVHRHGPDVSMDEIAATAGTSKSIIYRYFVDKPGLQRAVGEAVVAQMHTALDEAARAAGTPREALRSMIDIYLEMAEASPNVYWFVTRPVAEDAAGQLGHFLERVAGLVARPFARIVAVPGHERLADVWASGAVGFVRGIGEWWLTHRADDDAPSREELTERVTSWLWTGPVAGLARTRTGAAASTNLTPTDLEPNLETTDLDAEERS